MSSCNLAKSFMVFKKVQWTSHSKENKYFWFILLYLDIE